MEDYVADAALPLKKVLEDVASCEAYVGIFAWRHGYAPGGGAASPPPDFALPPSSAAYAETSITEWEYLKAKQLGRVILAFLLEEGVPWPPQMCDGAALGSSNVGIQRLRRELTQERMVSYFNSPADLGQKVSTAITVASMSRQMGVNLLDPTDDRSLQAVATGQIVMDSGKDSFINAILAAQSTSVVRIDLSCEWWSTRLFLLAFLMERLTDVRRILVERSLQALPTDPAIGEAPAPSTEFLGLLSTGTVQRVVGPMHVQTQAYTSQIAERNNWADTKQEAAQLIDIWKANFPGNEEQVQQPVTLPNLKRWFGDAMLCRALHIPDLSKATAFDIARLVDYPSDFVPITTFERKVPAARLSQAVKVVDKRALEAQLARDYLSDLLRRAGMRS